MIGIKVKGQYLDLSQSANTSTERNTPLVNGEEILGEFTYPFSIPANENNMKLLGFITELGILKTKEKIKVDAEYEEYNMLLYKGTLVAEFVQADLNVPERGKISIYFLTAISSFYSLARNVMLHELDLGGQRVIYNFREHAKSTWTGDADDHDYVFAPIHNKKFYPGIAEDPELFMRWFMNPIADLGQGMELNWILGEKSFVMPFIYYRYLLQRVFAHFGYTVSGALLDDPDFKKAYVPGFNSIVWTEWIFGNALPTVRDPVSFNLRDHVPVNYPVTKLLLGLANYFGIAFSIDTTRRHCELLPLNNLLDTAPRKDMSDKVNPSVKLEFQKEKKIYAVKLVFDPADTKVSKPDFSTMTRIADVNTVDDLPAATAQYENRYALIKYQNWFYACRYDEDLQDYMWNYVADNIYDYEPEGNNQTIESSITPVSQSHAQWRQLGPGGEIIRALFPHIEQDGNWPGKPGAFQNWELRILFYHGQRADPQGQLYPFSSSHNYTNEGVKVAQYSLSLNYPVEGMIAKFWQSWLHLLSGMETASFLLYLNLKDFRALRWNDIILIRNIPYLLTQITPQSPYNDQLPCKAIRIESFTPPPAEQGTCTAVVGIIQVVEFIDGSALFTFEQAAPGASAWMVSVDGQPAFRVEQDYFMIMSLGAGEHSIIITPMCGDTPNPAGAASLDFELFV